MKTMKYVVNEKAVRDTDSIIDRCEKSIPFEKRTGGQRVLELARKRILTHLLVGSISDIGHDITKLLQGYGLHIYSLKGTDLEMNKLKNPITLDPNKAKDFLSKPKVKLILKTLPKKLSLRQTAFECECSVNLVRKVKALNQSF